MGVNLRKKVKRVIEKAHSFKGNFDPEFTAKVVLVLLDDEIGLSGNGWFDDDPEMLDFLDTFWDDPELRKILRD